MQPPPNQLPPEQFLPSFFRAVYGHARHIRVAHLEHPATGGEPVMHNFSVTVEQAIQWALDNRSRSTANLYVAAGAHDGTGGYKAANFTGIGGLFVDLDTGEGNKFRDLDDAVAFLATNPVGRPDAAWVTGNGVQALFLFEQPLPFADGTPEAERLMQVWRQLNQVFLADTCDGPQHLFRIPTTLNHKPDKGTKQGYLLWWEPTRRWTLDTLAAGVSPWLEPEVPATEELEPVVVEAGGDVTPYDDLPEAIRDALEADHSTDRSSAMFTCVARMVTAGCNEATIHAAIASVDAFQGKYERRLQTEVDRCIRKATQSPWRIGESFVPLPIRDNVQTLALGECEPLPAPVSVKLTAYATHCGITLRPETLDAARFHEHVVAHNRQGVLLAPCGAGKSTWALSHIAAHANADTRHIYVVETVRQIYEAAAKLDAMTTVPVGRLHSFNPEKCRELCGQEHDWRRCSPDAADSLCHACPERERCCFYTRRAERQKPILVMTHAGLLRMIESGDAYLNGAHVIVDEDLDVCSTWDIPLDDLRLVETCHNQFPGWQCLFPHSRAQAFAAIHKLDLSKEARSFAARHYTFKPMDRTPGHEAMLWDNLRDELRKLLALQPAAQNAFAQEAAKLDRVKNVVGSLLSLMRGSGGQASYSFTEAWDRDQRAWVYKIRKQRVELGADMPWASFWMLNASAMLNTAEYPASLPVFTCPDLPDTSHLLSLNVVVSSPTKTALENNLTLTEIIQALGEQRGRHRTVMVATAKSGAGREEITKQLQALYVPNPAPVLIPMTRGRIKGSNEAGTATLAILSAMPLFTTVDDYALQAALLMKRHLPRSLVFDAKTDRLNMKGGRFALPAMRECYALAALDELYQTAWRAAVRNGGPTEVVMAIPDVSWMIALWRTVMPRAQVRSAYRIAGEKAAEAWRARVANDGQPLLSMPEVPEEVKAAIAAASSAEAGPVFESNRQILGLQSVINMPAGTRIGKKELAHQLGYEGDNAWRDNKDRILAMVSSWLEEEDGNNTRLVRR